MADQNTLFGDPTEQDKNFSISIGNQTKFGDPVDTPLKSSAQVSEEPSGYYEGFLSGLSNDENNKVFWLAKRRFPEFIMKVKIHLFIMLSIKTKDCFIWIQKQVKKNMSLKILIC